MKEFYGIKMHVATIKIGKKNSCAFNYLRNLFRARIDVV